ncbi:MAG: hypothetical protein ABJC13_06540 [Acidobacteriota bacterium]
MPRTRIAVVFCLFLLNVGASATPARASDGYGEPPRDCSDAVFFPLDEEVATKCGRSNGLSCLDVSGCFNLRRTRQLLADCQRAINALDYACYGGSYIFLKVELFSLQEQIDFCSERIALPEPEGCGRPCRL